MPQKPTPELKALKYVEGLGLNSVYEHAKERREWLVTIQDRLVQARDVKRRLEEKRLDREMEVSVDEHTKHTSMSATAMKDHLKIALQQDKQLSDIRVSIIGQQQVIDQLEFEVEQINVDIKIAVARLSELGGYFQFMAVLKASEAKRSQPSQAKPREDGNPW